MLCHTPTTAAGFVDATEPQLVIDAAKIEVAVDRLAGGLECSEHGYCVSHFNRAPGPAPVADALSSGAFVFPSCSCFSGYSGLACEDATTDEDTPENEWEADADAGITIEVLTEPPTEVGHSAALSPAPSFRLRADEGGVTSGIQLPVSDWWATGVGEDGEEGRTTKPVGLMVRVIISPDPISIVPTTAYEFSDADTGEVTFNFLEFRGEHGKQYELRFVATTAAGKNAVVGPFPVQMYSCQEGSKTDENDPDRQGCICLPGYGMQPLDDEGIVDNEGEVAETRRRKRRRLEEEGDSKASDTLLCAPCAAGSYSEENSYMPCTKCSAEGEESLWTSTEGAASRDECIPAGCMDEHAANYNDAVSVDDGSCIFEDDDYDYDDDYDKEKSAAGKVGEVVKVDLVVTEDDDGDGSGSESESEPVTGGPLLRGDDKVDDEVIAGMSWDGDGDGEGDASMPTEIAPAKQQIVPTPEPVTPVEEKTPDGALTTNALTTNALTTNAPTYALLFDDNDAVASIDGTDLATGATISIDDDEFTDPATDCGAMLIPHLHSLFSKLDTDDNFLLSAEELGQKFEAGELGGRDDLDAREFISWRQEVIVKIECVPTPVGGAPTPSPLGFAPEIEIDYGDTMGDVDADAEKTGTPADADDDSAGDDSAEAEAIAKAQAADDIKEEADSADIDATEKAVDAAEALRYAVDAAEAADAKALTAAEVADAAKTAAEVADGVDTKATADAVDADAAAFAAVVDGDGSDAGSTAGGSYAATGNDEVDAALDAGEVSDTVGSAEYGEIEYNETEGEAVDIPLLAVSLDTDNDAAATTTTTEGQCPYLENSGTECEGSFPGITQTECEAQGCCFDNKSTQKCYPRGPVLSTTTADADATSTTTAAAATTTAATAAAAAADDDTAAADTAADTAADADTTTAAAAAAAATDDAAAATDDASAGGAVEAADADFSTGIDYGDVDYSDLGDR
jgi:hypothetical protein